LAAQIDLLGCEYLGGCPTVGSRVLNKVELHFDGHGLTVAIAPQGLFTPAAARPVVTLIWPEITSLSATTRPGPSRRTARWLARGADIIRMRLDLRDELAVATPTWTMMVGVRIATTDLVDALHELLLSVAGPTPLVTAN
jgi:hypothetical protein